VSAQLEIHAGDVLLFHGHSFVSWAVKGNDRTDLPRLLTATAWLRSLTRAGSSSNGVPYAYQELARCTSLVTVSTAAG
jgi:hypothetical protein